MLSPIRIRVCHCCLLSFVQSYCIVLNVLPKCLSKSFCFVNGIRLQYERNQRYYHGSCTPSRSLRPTSSALSQSLNKLFSHPSELLFELNSRLEFGNIAVINIAVQNGMLRRQQSGTVTVQARMGPPTVPRANDRRVVRALALPLSDELCTSLRRQGQAP